MPVETSERSSTEQGEDLAALLQRVLDRTGMTQRAYAEAIGIPYQTLNAWITRRRGQAGGISSDVLRSVADASRGTVTVAEVHEAAGRVVPAELDKAREERLLKFYRGLDPRGQRALIEHAEMLHGMARLPRAK